MHHLRIVKLRRFLRLCASTAVKDSLAPIFSRSELFRLIQFPIFLFIVYLALGEMQMGEELTIWWAGKMAIIWAIPAWIALNVILSPFRVWNEQRKLGRWYGPKFIYNTPEPVWTLQIGPEDDDKVLSFKVRDAEPNTHVKFRVQYDGGIGKVQIGLAKSKLQINWDVISRETTYGVLINKRREAALIAHCPANSDPTIVRIQMLSWEVTPSKAMVAEPINGAR